MPHYAVNVPDVILLWLNAAGRLEILRRLMADEAKTPSFKSYFPIASTMDIITLGG